MNRGTKYGDIAEADFVKEFNQNKSNFKNYLDSLNIANINNVFMVRVTTKQFSKLSNQKVMTRADAYLIQSTDIKIQTILNDNSYYLDEDLINNANYNIIPFSGVSIKMSDSTKFQILKLTPDSFNHLFGEFELGAGASIYCLKENELVKNDSVFKGWKTSKENVIQKYANVLPVLKQLNMKVSLSEQLNIYKQLKNFSNKRISKIIDSSKQLQEIIFNGYHIYEEPYSASYFYKGNSIEKLDYIPFTITTGSGRSRGDFTIVLKPKN